MTGCGHQTGDSEWQTVFFTDEGKKKSTWTVPMGFNMTGVTSGDLVYMS